MESSQRQQPSLSESFAETSSIVYQISHKWSINDFLIYCDTGTNAADFYPMESIKFHHEKYDKLKFYLKIWPNGDREENKDYVSLYLHLAECERYFVRTRFKISLINGDKRKSRSLETRYKFTRLKNALGWPKFILRSELMHSVNKLLPNDKLIILCEITACVSRFDTKGYSPSPPLPQASPALIEADIDTTLLHDLSKLHATMKHSDIVFKINGKSYYAHKAILAARSPVFAGMFEHDMKENQDSLVIIPDINEKVFEVMLNFMYTGRIMIGDVPTTELLAVCDKYQLEPLKIFCEQYLSEKLSVDNAIEMLLFADMYNASFLKMRSISFVTDHPTEICASETWKLAMGKPELAQLAIRLFHVLANKTKPIPFFSESSV